MTERLDEILLYLYKFRYLTRNHIQLLLGHKQFNRVIIWLNELSREGYIRKYYDLKKVTEPAVYSLGLKGRKYLKENPKKEIKEALLDRVWREPKLTLTFRKHCLFVTECYLSLTKLVKTTGAKLSFYTKTELYGLKYLILPNPDIYFSIQETNGSKKCYFLDLFDDLPLRFELRQRVRQYFQYYDNNYWQDHNHNPFPSIIFVCPDNQSLNFLNRKILIQLEDEPDLSFYLSLRETIKAKGITKETIHKVELKNP
jgi:hypothetical protein